AGDSRHAHGGKHVGVAPEADLIAVRIGLQDDLTNSYLLNAAIEWVHEQAREKAPDQPVVISCSFGAPLYSHDGGTVQERRASAFLDLHRSGRILCVAAGNEGRRPIHGQVILRDAERVLEWSNESLSTLDIHARGARPGDVVWKFLGDEAKLRKAY